MEIVNFFSIKSNFFFGLCFKSKKTTYLYNRPDDKNFNLYFLEIIFAPVDLPVAAPPSHEICKNLFLYFKFGP